MRCPISGPKPQRKQVYDPQHHHTLEEELGVGRRNARTHPKFAGYWHLDRTETCRVLAVRRWTIIPSRINVLRATPAKRNTEPVFTTVAIFNPLGVSEQQQLPLAAKIIKQAAYTASRPYQDDRASATSDQQSHQHQQTIVSTATAASLATIDVLLIQSEAADRVPVLLKFIKEQSVPPTVQAPLRHRRRQLLPQAIEVACRQGRLPQPMHTGHESESARSSSPPAATAVATCAGGERRLVPAAHWCAKRRR